MAPHQLSAYTHIKSQRGNFLSATGIKIVCVTAGGQLVYHTLPRSGSAALRVSPVDRGYQVVINQKVLIIFKSESQLDTCDLLLPGRRSVHVSR